MYSYLLLSVSPYPNSALSAADRQPRHRRAAGTTSLPQLPRAQDHEREQPERKAA